MREKQHETKIFLIWKLVNLK